jgi:uncharacterized protein (DUF305 family)
VLHKALVPAAWLLVGVSVGSAGTSLLLTHSEQRSKPGASDIGFSQDMAAHHAQAVLMASMVRGRASPGIQALASQIETVQLGQMGVLNGWLALWGAPSLSPSPMQWMVPICGEGALSGLATQQDLSELQTASGPALDRTFLRLMLRHHRGGTLMDMAVIKGATLTAVRSFASIELSDEMGEIALMNQLQDRIATQSATDLPVPR